MRTRLNGCASFVAGPPCCAMPCAMWWPANWQSELMGNLARLGLNPENVMVCFKETTWENWSFGGGRLIHA